MTIIYPIKDLNNKNTEEYEEGTPWNKGLTKETDERIKKQSEKIKGKNNGAVKYLKGEVYSGKRYREFMPMLSIGPC